MKVTMYTLLGLIKDGKAPKKIKYINSIWEYDKETKDYFNDDLWLIYSMNSIGLTEREVEILEEEKKIPEKINWKPKESMAGQLTQKEQIEVIARRTEKLKKEFNNLLDYLKSKGDE